MGVGGLVRYRMKMFMVNPELRHDLLHGQITTILVGAPIRASTVVAMVF